jgi:hypothetical protein
MLVADPITKLALDATHVYFVTQAGLKRSYK